jgi:hypothetical protein
VLNFGIFWKGFSVKKGNDVISQSSHLFSLKKLLFDFCISFSLVVPLGIDRLGVRLVGLFFLDLPFGERVRYFFYFADGRGDFWGIDGDYGRLWEGFMDGANVLGFKLVGIYYIINIIELRWKLEGF